MCSLTFFWNKLDLAKKCRLHSQHTGSKDIAKALGNRMKGGEESVVRFVVEEMCEGMISVCELARRLMKVI